MILRFVRGLVLVCAVTLFSAAARSAESDVPPPTLTSGRVLVLGDSITQDGRYVDFVEYFLHRLAPSTPTDLISIGLSSETVSGLSEAGHPYPRPGVLERLDRALQATKPRIVLACYGMNDGIYHPASPERLAAFEHGLRQLASQVRAAGASLAILTPPVFDPIPLRAKIVPATAAQFGYTSPFADYDQVLAEFSRIAAGFRQPSVTVIDVHQAMTDALAEGRKKDPAFGFAPDGIHPNDAGHLLIARAVLRGFGYPEESTPLADIEADPIFAKIRERRQLRSEAWLPFVGYVRGGAFKSASVAASERVAARLQAEIAAAK